MALKTRQILQDRYRIISLMSQGGMGAVYQASDARLDVEIALKEMFAQPGVDSETLAQLRRQFRQEAKVLARLNHPHLVRVSDFFEERGNAYLVMDLVEGENLADRIDREGALPEDQVLEWASQLLDALAYCHSQGVIHRDVKPQNVIIRPDGRAVLVDFGLVKLWDDQDPRTKTAMRGMGTPEYAPPEQYEMQMGHTDARSDIYGIGATLYHTLVGHAPPTATLRMSDPEQFKSLRDVVPAVSERTEAAVMKALELPRTQRWQNAREMARALSVSVPVWVAGEAQTPLRPRPRQATRRMEGKSPDQADGAAAVRPESTRRGMPKGVWITGVLVALALVLGGTGWFWQSRRQTESPTPTRIVPAVAEETPSPTVTPQPTSTSAPIRTPTPVPPTSTPFSTPTSASSPTPSPSPTPTPSSAPTYTPTATQAPAQTPTPVNSPMPSPTPGDSPALTSTPVAQQPSPTPLPPPPDGEMGRIFYTIDAGQNYYLATTDPSWSQGQVIDPVTYQQSTCGGQATASTLLGHTVNLFYGYRCGIGSPKECPSPDGQYKVSIWHNEASGYSLSVYRVSDNALLFPIYQGKLNTNEPILWAPDGSRFYFTIDHTLHQATPYSAGYSPVIPIAYEPYLSPDGSMIVYLQPVGTVGAYDIWVANADGSNARNLTNAPDAYKLCPRWGGY